MLQNRWEQWCRAFLESDTREMTPDEAKVLTICLMNDNNVDFPGPGLEESFSWKVFNSRAEHLGARFSKGVATFICSISDSPGTLVMWSHLLAYMNHNMPGCAQHVDMRQLCQSFPLGFPTDEAMHKLWDSQKLSMNERSPGGGTDNGLDVANPRGFYGNQPAPDGLGM